jgi:hypothetical protein
LASALGVVPGILGPCAQPLIVPACRGDTRRCGQKRRRECDPELGGNSASRYQFLASQRYLPVKTE